MTVLDDILKKTTPRVSAPEALGVPPSTTTTLSAANELAPPGLEKLPPADATQVIETVKGTLDEAADAAAASAKAAQAVPLSYFDVAAARVKAVIVTELERRYLRWKHLKLGDWQQELTDWADLNPGVDSPRIPRFTPEHRVVHAKELEEWAEALHQWALAQTPPLTGVSRRLPFDYFTGNRTGRSHTLLTLLFGEKYGRRLKEMAGIASPRRQLAAKWPRLVSCVWPPPDADAVKRLRELLQLDPSDTALGDKVAELLQDHRVVVGFGPADAPKATAMIRKLAARYAPNGDLLQLTVEALLELTGKPMTYEEFIHRSLIALDIMADEADQDRAPELFEQVLEVQGIESFLAMVLQKSGFEHGYVFEVFLVLRRLFENGDPAKIWMQIVVDGKQGPDIGYILGEGLARTVRLIQAKSYRDINALMRPTATGEYLAPVAQRPPAPGQGPVHGDRSGRDEAADGPHDRVRHRLVAAAHDVVPHRGHRPGGAAQPAAGDGLDEPGLLRPVHPRQGGRDPGTPGLAGVPRGTDGSRRPAERHGVHLRG